MTLDYVVQTIRASAVLTNSYVAATVIGLDSGVTTQVQTGNQLVVAVDFTKGSLTSCELKIEFSPDNSDYYQFPWTNAPTSGVSVMEAYILQLTATGKLYIPIPIKARYIKISANGTGTVTNSLLKLIAVVGTA